MNKSASSSRVETETVGVSTPSPAMRRIVVAIVAVAAPILVVLAPWIGILMAGVLWVVTAFGACACPILGRRVLTRGNARLRPL